MRGALRKCDIAEHTPEGVINIHGALLPKYRGKLLSFWVLANGDEKKAVAQRYVTTLSNNLSF